MGDLSHVQREKEKILSLINSSGPSFPSKIARETGIQPLFAAAFMAELLGDRKLKVTAMKVGSSPIYYLQGQEANLEKFAEYLSQKEREAFFMLQSTQILEDEKQDPAMRVALRKLKDFAFPINVKVDGEAKLFWKYYLVPDTELAPQIEKLVSPSKKQEKEKLIEKTPEKLQEKPKLKEKEELEKPARAKKAKKEKEEHSNFIDRIKSYLTDKELELVHELTVKKKEYHAKVQHESKFGNQQHLVIAKDKKTLKTEDFLTAIQKAQAEKMPALFLAPGSPDKIASEYLKEWHNLLKFEQL